MSAAMLASLAQPMMSGIGEGLGSAIGGGGGPTTSKADGNKVDAIFDNSGWNVNFGEGDITSDRQQLPALGGIDTTTLVIMAAVALVALKLLKKKS